MAVGAEGRADPDLAHALAHGECDDRHQVVRWFLMRGLRLSLAGMVLGLTLSVIVVRLTAAMRGEEPSSAIIGIAALVACVAITVALVATWIPARRATSVDPLLALRVE